jgi:flagellar hook-length control protein FliK
MSQITGLTSTSVATSNAVYGTSGQANTNDQGFGQALLAMLGGNNTNSDSNSSTLSLLTLTGLVEGANSNQIQGEDDTVAKLLLDLGDKLGQIEDMLSQDEQLLAVLQNWLQGVQALLQPSQVIKPDAGNEQVGQALSELANPPHGGALAIQNVVAQLLSSAKQSQLETGEVNRELPELAKHPQTIKFAIQDAVAQLLSSAKQLPAGETKLPADQIQTMLQSLQQVLDQASIDNKHVKANSNLNQILSSTVQADGQKGGQTELSNTIHASKPVGNENQHNEHESMNALQNGQVITAGQLALRHHANAEVKNLPAPVPVQNFAKEVSGFLVGKFDIAKFQGISEARISLYPEHLGQVDVKITMQNGHMVAQFVTEHLLAKESLEGQMGQLRSALQAQGIQVTKLEVTQNSSLSSHMYHNDSQSRQRGSGQEQGNRRGELKEEDHLLVNDLNEEWNEWMAELKTREVTYGSSFVAKA